MSQTVPAAEINSEYPANTARRKAAFGKSKANTDQPQAAPHMPVNVRELDCDFYGASLHKWLSAPIGTGMLYVRKDRIERHWALMAAPASKRTMALSRPAMPAS